MWRLPAERTWTVDDANKYLLARAVAAGEWERPALPYPGRALDPGLRWVPIPPPFARVWHGRLVSVFPPAFAVLSGLAYRGLGPRGLYLAPILGALGALAGAACLARRLQASPAVAALCAGPCGPLFFYWTLLWEHTLAAAATAWSVAAVLRAREGQAPRWLLVAGLALAAGTWVRDELLIVSVAMALACALDRPLRRALPSFAVAYLAGWAPAALWRLSLTGGLVGFHGPGSVHGLRWSGLAGLGTAVGHGVVVLYSLLLAVHPRPVVSLALTAGPLVAVALLAWAPRWLGRAPVLGPIALGVAADASVLMLTALGSMPALRLRLVSVSGLVGFAPWVVLIGAAWLPADAAAGGAAVEAVAVGGHRRWLATFAVLSLLGFGLVLTPAGVQGIHWGPRHMSPLVPSLAALAALGATRLVRGTREQAGARWAGWVRVALAVVLATALAVQLDGFRLQGRVAEALEEIAAPVRGRGEAVLVTRLWWYAQLTLPAYLERPMYGIASREDLEAWLVRYADAGGHRFEWATQASLESLTEGLPLRVTRTQLVQVRGLDALGHVLVAYEIVPADASPRADAAWRRLRGRPSP